MVEEGQCITFQSPTETLVGEGGIGKAVAQNDKASCQCGAEHFRYVLGSVCGKQEHLRLRGHYVVTSVEQQFPDRGAQMGVARLGRCQAGDTFPREVGSGNSKLRGLTRPLDTLEADQPSHNHFVSLSTELTVSGTYTRPRQ